MRKETEPKWGDPDAPVQPAKKADAPKPGTQPAPDPEPKGGDEPTPEPVTPPADITPEQKKKNPWVLYREEKARAQKLETQIAEAKAGSLAETEKAQYLERITKAEEKLKTYEDEIRFKSYEKSDEFKTKYEQPYENAWNKHMKDLGQVPVTGEDGTPRMATHNDLLELVNLSLPDARKMATEKWGDFAQDAMAARKDIRELFEAKTSALDEARKTGAEREKAFQENAAKWREGVQKHIKETWDAANQEALSDPNNGEFFKPVEGDDTRNQILGKGFAQVDRAFGINPMDPKLTPDERAAAVRLHAAVRNRSAGYGVQKYINRKLLQRIAELEKANEQFKGSTPPAGGGTAAPSGAPTTSARSRMQQAGEKWAK